jgi:hypothetical protein
MQLKKLILEVAIDDAKHFDVLSNVLSYGQMYFFENSENGPATIPPSGQCNISAGQTLVNNLCRQGAPKE